jgi:hypothetical protein
VANLLPVRVVQPTVALSQPGWRWSKRLGEHLAQYDASSACPWWREAMPSLPSVPRTSPCGRTCR